MESDLAALLDDEDEDAILAQVQEESLKHFNEVELPQRIASVEAGPSNADGNHDSSMCYDWARVYSIASNEDRKGISYDVLYRGQEAAGFHLAAGDTYIYPTNYPIRDYQANIVRSALFHNTLVSLPTGLGKTFIAAVVMYNYYRWYPNGKIVFMAPTRPLVAQQIRACYDIMATPLSDTVEMTGSMTPVERRRSWQDKRLFFLTPQVMANDLRSRVCPAETIKCLVIDEAHRATKDYAYCQVVRSLVGCGAVFRLVALSATPGNDVAAVKDVVRNLLISKLEVRGEDSLDVAPYTHRKQVRHIVVELSPQIQQVKRELLMVYEQYAKSLKDARALTANISIFTKFQVLKSMERFRSNPPRGMQPTVAGLVMSDFSVCMTLSHALELLQTYGLRAFYNYLHEELGEGGRGKGAATRLRNNPELNKLLAKLRAVIYPEVGVGPEDYVWSHPKLERLVDVLVKHFTNPEVSSKQTKAIIFCNYRVVVNEVVEVVGKLAPLVRPVMFIGHGGGKERGGMNQAKQLQIMRDFRAGQSNCLVSTSVGEEGLDVGEVDLILLVESQRSAIRLVQRLGRTGRNRRGSCVVLLTRGRELQPTSDGTVWSCPAGKGMLARLEGVNCLLRELWVVQEEWNQESMPDKFNEAMETRKSYVTRMLNSTALPGALYPDSPAMIPKGFKPHQQLVHVQVKERVTPAKARKSGAARSKGVRQRDIREVINASLCLSETQWTDITTSRFKRTEELWHRNKDAQMPCVELLDGANRCGWHEWTDCFREPQPTFHVEHSANTTALCYMLQRANNLRQRRWQADGFPLNASINMMSTNPSVPKPMNIGEDYPCEDTMPGSLGMVVETPVVSVVNRGKPFTKKGKQPKKYIAKRNDGMDIRNCMAVAAKKQKTAARIINAEVVTLDDSIAVLEDEESISALKESDKIVADSFESIFKEWEPATWWTSKDTQLSKLLDNFSFPEQRSQRFAYSIPPLPDICDLLKGITIDIIKNLDVPCINMRKHDLTGLNLDSEWNSSTDFENELCIPTSPRSGACRKVGMHDSYADSFVGLDDLFIEEYSLEKGDKGEMLDYSAMELQMPPDLKTNAEVEEHASHEPHRMLQCELKSPVLGTKDIHMKKVNDRDPGLLRTKDESQDTFKVEETETHNVSDLNAFGNAALKKFSAEDSPNALSLHKLKLTDDSRATMTPMKHAAIWEDDWSHTPDSILKAFSALDKNKISPVLSGKCLIPLCSTPKIQWKNLFGNDNTDDRKLNTFAVTANGNEHNKQKNDVETEANKLVDDEDGDEDLWTVSQLFENEIDVKMVEKCALKNIFNESNLNDTSLYTITQLVDMVDQAPNKKQLVNCNVKSKDDQNICSTEKNEELNGNKEFKHFFDESDADIFADVCNKMDDSIDAEDHVEGNPAACITIGETSSFANGQRILEPNQKECKFLKRTKALLSSQAPSVVGRSVEETLEVRQDNNVTDQRPLTEIRKVPAVTRLDTESVNDWMLLQTTMPLLFHNGGNRKHLTLRKGKMKEKTALLVSSNKEGNSCAVNSNALISETSYQPSTRGTEQQMILKDQGKDNRRVLVEGKTSDNIDNVSDLEKLSPNFDQRETFEIGFSCDQTDSSNSNDSIFLKPMKIGSPCIRNEGKKRRPPSEGSKKVLEFVELEAEVTGDWSGSEGVEDSSDLDQLEASFIDDNTQLQDRTELHANYLRSVRSPLMGRGRFKITAMAQRPSAQSFSQEDQPDESQYKNDSFCVDETTDYDTPMTDVSLLEEAEKLLANSRKRKRRKIKRKRRCSFIDTGISSRNVLNESLCVIKKRKVCHIKSDTESD